MGAAMLLALGAAAAMLLIVALLAVRACVRANLLPARLRVLQQQAPEFVFVQGRGGSTPSTPLLILLPGNAEVFLGSSEVMARYGQSDLLDTLAVNYPSASLSEAMVLGALERVVRGVLARKQWLARRLAIVGFSMGGYFGAQLALRFPGQASVFCDRSPSSLPVVAAAAAGVPRWLAALALWVGGWGGSPTTAHSLAALPALPTLPAPQYTYVAGNADGVVDKRGDVRRGVKALALQPGRNVVGHRLVAPHGKRGHQTPPADIANAAGITVQQLVNSWLQLF